MPFSQPPVTPNPTGINLQGKTAIITGGNTGMGFETARQLLTLSLSNLILAVRNISKGETAKNVLLAHSEVQARNPNAVITVMQLDMDDYNSVKVFAAKVKAQVLDLHLLILNAGTGLLKLERSPSGHDRTTQVNYLSNVLLVSELLPLLESTADRTGTPSRITWVGSRIHWRTSLAKKPVQPGSSIFDHFDDMANYSTFMRYGDTKLLCTMFVYELAKRVSSDKVIVNIMCPGMVNTAMGDILPLYLRIPVNLVKKMRARTVEEGGRLIVYSAAVAGPETHGQFVVDKSISP
jgi:NAD(P)-dependent dehydrogenase (short-subunit alcohol dehydrogenase family)